MRIAVVNDSIMAVESLRQVIAASSKHSLAWVAHDGEEAVAKCRDDRPDILLMDLIMPKMDGVEATRQIMAESPCAIVVVTASVTGNAAKVFHAMGAGALDAINTPVLGLSGTGEGQAMLLQKIDTVAKLINVTEQTQATENQPRAIQSAEHSDAGQRLICIGSSTGGPAALKDTLACLPADLPAAIVIVQHVDQEFAPSFASWLDSEIPLPVRLADEGDCLLPGQVLVAGREEHLMLGRDQRLHYTPEPVEYAYRPSVNVFFESVAENWRHMAVGVLLTGMGRDGGAGLLNLRQAGCHTIAQDRETSAIYGMPKAAAELDAAVDILPLGEIGPALAAIISKNE